jgi:hypothetical protein
VDDGDALTHVRAIVGRGDHAELVAALRHQPWPGDSLQLIGDGLLAALRDGTDGSVDLAQACVTALDAPEWDGDRELADALNAALGTGPTPMLRPLPVGPTEVNPGPTDFNPRH